MINWIILGLGNPGEKFENTRHNISWWALDIISNKLSGYKSIKKKKKIILNIDLIRKIGMYI